jgi:hypothetical protein
MRAFAFASFVVLLSFASCKPKEEEFESVLSLIARNDLELDDKGQVEQADFKFEWDPCPGDQFQMVRGGREFAACMKKYEVGDYVSVRVRHIWDTHGFYKWDITKVGDCLHTLQPNAEGSYEQSQECTDEIHHGRVVGFACSRTPQKRLIALCPFMAR